jgi:hypothetical protein
MSAIDDRLKELGITLPAAKKPAFEYVAVAVHGDTASVDSYHGLMQFT